MSARMAKEISCLHRLNELTNSLPEICQFLLDERLITKDRLALVRAATMKAKEVHTILSELKEEEKLQMLEYKWEVLPAEIIIITIVTNSAKREFTYTAF